MYYDSQFIWYKVLGQILLVQLGFYIIMAFCNIGMDLVLSVNPKFLPLQLFNWTVFHLDSVMGYATIISFFLTSVLTCLVLLVVVGKARKCLDFSGTLYFLHFILVCVLSSSFPLNGVWWVFMTLGLILSTVLGEIICLKREMQEIPVSAGV